MKTYMINPNLLSTPIHMTLNGSVMDGDTSLTIKDVCKYYYFIPAHMDILRPSKYTVPDYPGLLRISKPQQSDKATKRFDILLGKDKIFQTEFGFENCGGTKTLRIDMRLLKPEIAPKGNPISMTQLAFCPAVIFACAFQKNKLQYNIESRFAFGCHYKNSMEARFFIENLIESYSLNRLESDRLRYYTLHPSPNESIAIFEGPLVQIEPNFRKLTYTLDMVGRDAFSLLNQYHLPNKEEWQAYYPRTDLQRN